jgi:gas vesicle protein GvpL/GvpF
MSTHLYCVLPHAMRASIPAGLSGLAGARVRALPVEGIVAWVSDVARELRVSIEGVRAHDAVVEAALETGTTPVPARFGQRFKDDDACRAALSSRATSVESLLSTMQGFVEMTLIITPSTRRMLRDLQPVIPEMLEPPTRGAGRQYLETLQAREAATGAVRTAMDKVANALNAAAEPFVRRAAVHEQLTRLPFRTISHLIQREAIADYKRAVGDVPSDLEFRFLLIGPRAPYSFCALGDSGGTHGMNLAD